MARSIEIFPSLPELMTRSKQLVLDQLQSSFEAKGYATFVLAGGSTPKALYQLLAQESLPWEKIHCFWGDERYVSPTHPDSNERMAREAWFNHVAIPEKNLHPMPTHDPDPFRSAREYEKSLQDFFEISSGQLPIFDVVLLGMGDDGHTASLFPQTTALGVVDRLVTVGNKDGQPRLTLTYPVINQAHCVIFLVTGENKRPALSHVLAERGDALNYPSRLIQPQGKLYWLLDEKANPHLPF